MEWVLLVLVLCAACVLVVGGSGPATRGWWLVGLWSWWGGAGGFWCWGGWCCGWLKCRCVAAVGGAGDAVGEGAAGGSVGDVEGEGAVDAALVDGCVLTVGVGPRRSWRSFPWALLEGVLAPLVSLMSMVLYRVVSPWWLSLTFWVVVAEVALSVAVSVMPVVRSLRALLRFTASLMLLMLLVVGVGLCVGGQWPVFGVVRCLVSVGLSGRVCSRWFWAAGDAAGEGGAGDALGGVVGEGGVGGAGGVGAAGDCVVDGALWLLWW